MVSRIYAGNGNFSENTGYFESISQGNYDKATPPSAGSHNSYLNHPQLETAQEFSDDSGETLCVSTVALPKRSFGMCVASLDLRTSPTLVE